MYCTHFLPAVYWSLMTWAARWTDVLRNYCYLPLALPPEVLQWANYRVIYPLSSFNFVDTWCEFNGTSRVLLSRPARRFMTPLVKPSSVHWGSRRINFWSWCQFESTWWYGMNVVRMGVVQMCVLCDLLFVTYSLRFKARWRHGEPWHCELTKPTMLMSCKANTTNSTAPWPWPRATNPFGRDGNWTVYWFMEMLNNRKSMNIILTSI